jgi:hypothetical protein
MVDTARLKARGRWTELAQQASYALAVGPDPAAFEDYAAALRALGRFDLLENLALSSRIVAPEAHSALAVRNAWDKRDLCCCLRRAEAHFSRYGCEGSLLEELASVCTQLGLSVHDIETICEGRVLARLLSKRLHSTRPHLGRNGWPQKALGLNESGRRDDALSTILKCHDWASQDVSVGQALVPILGNEGLDALLVDLLQLGPFQNGARSVLALETYVGALFRLGRMAEIADCLAFGAPTPKLHMYSVLACGALGRHEPGFGAESPAPETDEQRSYRSLIELRTAALQRWRPARSPGRRPSRPRVALCVSGQLRGFQEAMPRLLSQLRSVCEVDVFVTTWDNPGLFLPRGIHLDRIFSRQVADFFRNKPGSFRVNVKAILPGLPSIMGADAQARIGRLSEVFAGAQEIKIEPEAAFDRFLERKFQGQGDRFCNQYKMFYLIHRTWRMAADHMKRTGCAYDLMVRVRPDLLVARLGMDEILQKVVADDVVGFVGCMDDGVDDKFAVSTPRAMQAYASVWPKLVAAGSHRYLPSVGEWMAERLLLRHLFAEGCRPTLLYETRRGPLLATTVRDEEILGYLMELAARRELTRDQTELADLLQAATPARSGPAMDGPKQRLHL